MLFQQKCYYKYLNSKNALKYSWFNDTYLKGEMAKEKMMLERHTDNINGLQKNHKEIKDLV